MALSLHGALLTLGKTSATSLTVHTESDNLVALGDGMEDDGLTLSWGQHVTIGLADRHLSTLE